MPGRVNVAELSVLVLVDSLGSLATVEEPVEFWPETSLGDVESLCDPCPKPLELDTSC